MSKSPCTPALFLTFLVAILLTLAGSVFADPITPGDVFVIDYSALATRRSPLAAMAMPRGCTKLPPDETTV